MAKAKYVKLGEKASIFFDPTSKLKVTPGKAVELSNEHKMSKRVIKGIKSGHLDYVDSDELEEMDVVSLEQATKPQPKAETETEDEEEDEDDDAVTKEKLMKLKKPELIQKAKDNETEIPDDELAEMKKEELADEILELLEEE